jgi:hypothetical protein
MFLMSGLCGTLHRQVGDDEDREDKEDFADWIDQLHGFLHQINVVDICPPPTSDYLPLPFPHISTLTQATDLSEEDTSMPDKSMPNTSMPDTTYTDIDDYILVPRSAQAKVDDSCLLKVFQWLHNLR